MKLFSRIILLWIISCNAMRIRKLENELLWNINYFFRYVRPNCRIITSSTNCRHDCHPTRRVVSINQAHMPGRSSHTNCHQFSSAPSYHITRTSTCKHQSRTQWICRSRGNAQAAVNLLRFHETLFLHSRSYPGHVEHILICQLLTSSLASLACILGFLIHLYEPNYVLHITHGNARSSKPMHDFYELTKVAEPL